MRKTLPDDGSALSRCLALIDDCWRLSRFVVAAMHA
jgi:hypothetical protein